MAVYDRRKDKFLLRSDEAGIDEIPEDIDGDRYVEVPSKRDLDLGRDLVFRFVKEAMPDDLDLVYDFFSHRGAYGNFRDFLDRRSMVDQWHKFEDAATRKALLEWSEDNNIKVTKSESSRV